ncbi:hypothetical protein [Deinococcus sp. RL]|uniref:hypothetical protein n=1 Tax=Deinococcus sp. RL TaxID=1489678 RepID=UPI0012686527|nr:hypothetical protein [Deinococcus sp. RL]
MAGLSWIQTTVCAPGTLVITADGEEGAGESPQLDIALNGRVIASESFGRRRTAEIAVPGAGILTLTFVNDLFLADVRLATFAQPYLLGGSCNQIREVRVPPESAGGWDEFSRSGTVVRNSPPITMVPCGAGRLSIALKGQAAAGEYPQVVFRQGNQVVKRVFARKEFTRLNFPVDARPLALAIENPYAILKSDRNLNLRNITYKTITSDKPIP